MTMFRTAPALSIALTLAALCACQREPTVAELAVAREVHPIILGEPGPGGVPRWRAVLEPGRLRLDSPTSAGWYSLPLPAPLQDPVARRLRYETAQVTLVMETGACAISEYRAALPNRAVLEWDGGRFEGCNGRGTLPDRIAGTTWELVRIGADPAPAGRSPAATLIFGANGSLGGTLACNDGGIRTAWAANGVFVRGEAGFEQTAIGCNDAAVEAFGGRFWRGLMAARSWRREQHRLWIILADGTEAELRFLI